jgi:putative methyltransferase
MEWAIRNPVVYMFIADANFGIFKERDVEIAKMIRDVSIRGQLEAVNLTYAKNSTEIIFEIGKIIGNLSKGVTVSVQSMNQSTLEAIKRDNLDVNDVKYYMHLSEEHAIPTYTEVILGLPDETLDSWKQGFDQILEMGQHNAIDVWPCQVLENSELASLESRIKYGIETVVAHEYTPFYNKDDYMDISETVEIVKSTNTMCMDEMVEAYMYAWMMVQFHILGYTQIFAKHARHVLNIPYRKFYDVMFEKIQQDEFFGTLFQDIKQNIHHYLDTGTFINKSMNGHTLSGTSAKTIYDNKTRAYNLGRDCALEFSTDISTVDNIQRNFIYCRDLSLPMVVEFPWDIYTWESKSTKYVISTKLAIDENFNFFTTRRNGLLKNIFTKIS